MSSFSCPHFESEGERCMRLQADCIPGRPGCVLHGNSRFAVPWEERLRQRLQEKRGEEDDPGDRAASGR